MTSGCRKKMSERLCFGRAFLNSKNRRDEDMHTIYDRLGTPFVGVSKGTGLEGFGEWWFNIIANIYQRWQSE